MYSSVGNTGAFRFLDMVKNESFTVENTCLHKSYITLHQNKLYAVSCRTLYKSDSVLPDNWSRTTLGTLVSGIICTLARRIEDANSIITSQRRNQSILLRANATLCFYCLFEKFLIRTRMHCKPSILQSVFDWFWLILFEF